MIDDNVDHPMHYNIGYIEVFDYIKDKLEPDEFKGYCKGNIIKYISRENHKGKLEDLRKAQWYLNKLVLYLYQSKIGLSDSVNIAGSILRSEQKPIDKCGIIAPLPCKPEDCCEKKDKKNTIKEKGLKETLKKLDEENEFLKQEFTTLRVKILDSIHVSRESLGHVLENQ